MTIIELIHDAQACELVADQAIRAASESSGSDQLASLTASEDMLREAERLRNLAASQVSQAPIGSKAWEEARRGLDTFAVLWDAGHIEWRGDVPVLT